MSKRFGSTNILYDSDIEIANEITVDPFSEEPRSQMHNGRCGKKPSKSQNIKQEYIDFEDKI